MSEVRKIRYDYVLKVLNDTLRKEESSLNRWKEIIENPNSDALSLRQANGNLSSNQHRVDELKKVIEVINT